MRGHGRHGHRARTRWRDGDGWRVSARVERFVEPLTLLALVAGPAHGYRIAEGVLGATEAADVGNFYRLLRGLEEDGLVSSEWDDEDAERPRRVYSLTDDGRGALDAWAVSLGTTQDVIDAFLRDYQKRTPKKTT
jgi:PadR family transcriptional regulator PadR